MHRYQRNNLLLFIVFSLFLHLSVWSTLTFKEFTPAKPESAQIEIVVLDQSPKKRLQIVEQPAQPINDDIPEEAKYLGAHNQRIVKETRAAKVGDFRNSTGRGDDASPRPPQQAARPKPVKQAKRLDGQLPTLSDLRPTFDPSVARDEQIPRAGGGLASQTNDHIKDTPPSLETLLSTREFIYYSYYQRIRSQIRQFWEPSIRGKVKKIFAQGRSLASEHDHVTRVVITLNKEGALLRVQVVGESGLKDLDDAAVEAFRAAEPFPNPPQGIVENDGTIKINWDFILEA